MNFNLEKREDRRSLFELSSDYFREASVLIAVFGVLDKVLRHEEISFWYLFTLNLISFILFAMGFSLECLRSGKKEEN